MQLNLEQSVFCQPRQCRKGHGSSNIRPPASLKAVQGAQRALPEESEFLKFQFISSLGYISIVGGRRDFCPVQSEADGGTPYQMLRIPFRQEEVQQICGLEVSPVTSACISLAEARCHTLLSGQEVQSHNGPGIFCWQQN